MTRFLRLLCLQSCLLSLLLAGCGEEEYLMGVGYSEHDLLLAEIAA